MDALEFIRERKRMCKHFRGCAGCPADCSTIWDMHDAEKLVQVVEQWAKEHPRKTRQDEFLERWPEARVDKDGVLFVCPADIVKSLRDEYGGCANPMEDCPKCRREFWGQEVE